MTHSLRFIQNKLSFWVKAIHSFAFVILFVCISGLHTQFVVNGKIINAKIQEPIAGMPVIIRLASIGLIDGFDMNKTISHINQKDVQFINVLNCGIYCVFSFYPFLYGEMRHRMHSRLM